MRIRAIAAGGVFAAVLLVPPVGAAEPRAATAEVRIETVEVVSSLVGPVVLLKADAKAIPIFVDPTVAESIHAVLNKRKTPRPLSHDLMRSILQSYGGKVTQVQVSLREATYHGALTIDVGGSTKVFDARSSDAIALAIHFSAPILVTRELLDNAGKPLEAPPGQRML